ncbi:MAG: hypothetical protein GKR89_31530 [Candidatus Latescibacteria bacterium]|nr:hypothetical protein [Candidatus Latescibacterota bacterium]
MQNLSMLFFCALAVALFPIMSSAQRIAFTSLRDGNMELYSIAPDGGNLLRLTDHPGKDLNPSWSPDGMRLAFESDRDGNAEVYLINRDGSNPVRLTDAPGEDGRPAWSPNGQFIAYYHQSDGGEPQIHIMRPDGQFVRNLAPTSAHTQLQWTPNSQAVLAYMYDEQGTAIYRIDLDDAPPTPLTYVDDSDNGFSLSADGQRLVLAAEIDDFGSELFVLELDSNTPQRLTKNLYRDTLPCWSPEGTHIVFTAFQGGPPMLYIMDLASGNTSPLTTTPANFGCAWSLH